MSASTYQNLLQHVFVPKQPKLKQTLNNLYQELETALQEARPGRTSQEQVSFRFERLRLGIGIALMQLLTDLGGDEDSSQVQQLLEDALKAKNTGEIDTIIQKRSQVFDDLFTDLFVNPEAEAVLGLFERMLDAASKEEADDIIEETSDLAQTLEIQSDNDPLAEENTD